MASSPRYIQLEYSTDRHLIIVANWCSLDFACSMSLSRETPPCRLTSIPSKPMSQDIFSSERPFPPICSGYEAGQIQSGVAVKHPPADGYSRSSHTLSICPTGKASDSPTSRRVRESRRCTIRVKHCLRVQGGPYHGH